MARPRDNVSLDLDMRHCLIDFEDDEIGYLGYHRLLLVKGVPPSLRVVSTPTMFVQFLEGTG